MGNQTGFLTALHSTNSKKTWILEYHVYCQQCIHLPTKHFRDFLLMCYLYMFTSCTDSNGCGLCNFKTRVPYTTGETCHDNFFEQSYKFWLYL